jgi:hypothetical protein
MGTFSRFCGQVDKTRMQLAASTNCVVQLEQPPISTRSRHTCSRHTRHSQPWRLAATAPIHKVILAQQDLVAPWSSFWAGPKTGPGIQ